MGYYVCSALNAAGSNIAKAYLKVSGRGKSLSTSALNCVNAGFVKTLPAGRALGQTHDVSE